MVHMPAHIYVRVGRYADAIESNRHAVHTDENYIADQRPSGIYPFMYYPHNYHFLAFAATMAGRSAQAIEAARTLAGKLTLQVVRKFPELEPLLPYPHLTLVSFGRWDEVLAEPLPAKEFRFATAMAHYARGVAFAAKEKWSEANAALTRVKSALAATLEGTGKTVLKIATHALAGEIAARHGELNAPLEHFKLARELEDSLRYIEPPLWYYPMRHSLGKALLAAGRPEEAETVYREDLKRFPENGWALYGLEASLRDQGNASEARKVEERFRRAWAGADVALTASRF
jgi:tetratricopeptide (TPR) repeat protein